MVTQSTTGHVDLIAALCESEGVAGMTKTQRRIGFFAYYVLFATVIAMSFGSKDWLTHFQLAIKGIDANAVVTETACTRQMPISYRFKVGEQSYEGRGGDGFGNPSCASLKSGDQFLISYLPANPGVNVPGDPAARLTSEISAIAMLALFVPIIFLFVGFSIVKMRSKPS